MLTLHHERIGQPASPIRDSVRPPRPERPHEKLGVLVVDDDKLVRRLVQVSLERNGFQVWVASGGREAIDLYGKERENVDVVLLDVLMPGLDGPETLAALRRLNPDLHACFMSGDTGVYNEEELLQRGAAGFIAKPFRLDHLVDTLRTLA